MIRIKDKEKLPLPYMANSGLGLASGVWVSLPCQSPSPVRLLSVSWQSPGSLLAVSWQSPVSLLSLIADGAVMGRHSFDGGDGEILQSEWLYLYVVPPRSQLSPDIHLLPIRFLRLHVHDHYGARGRDAGKRTDVASHHHSALHPDNYY